MINIINIYDIQGNYIYYLSLLDLSNFYLIKYKLM